MKYAIENGIINIENVLDNIEEMEKTKILKQHPYEIWTGSDGRVRTYLYDETRKNNRKLIAKSTMEKIEKAIIDDYNNRQKENEKDQITFDYAYHKWLETYLKEEELVKGSVDRYNVDYKLYYKDTEFSSKEISKITERDVISFLKNVLSIGHNGEKLKRKAFTNIKSIISGTFKFAKTYLEVDCIPITHTLSDIKIPSKKFKPNIVKDCEQVFSEEEATKLASHIISFYKDNKDLGVLLTLLTGLRIGELAALKTTDQIGDMLYISRTEIRERDKDGHNIIKVRDFPKSEASANGIQLSESAMIVLSLIKKINFQNGVKSDWLFFNHKTCKRTTTGCFDTRIRKICNTIGIPPRSMHKLRKTYASNLFANNVEEKIVQGQMRHRSSTTTHKYYEFSIRSKEYKKEQLNNADMFIPKIKKCNQV